MSDNTTEMPDFILQRQDDPFFMMPPDSLISLSAHTPVMKTILQYLPLEAKKNLRLAHPRKLKDVLFDDPSWIWTVNLGYQIEYPDIFFMASTPVIVNFPRDEEGDLIKNPDNCGQMFQLIQKIKDRTVGLAINLETLENYRDQLKFASLKFLEVMGCRKSIIGIGAFISLLTDNAHCIENLILVKVKIPEKVEVGVRFPNLKEFRVALCPGGFNFASAIISKAIKVASVETDGKCSMVEKRNLKKLILEAYSYKIVNVTMMEDLFLNIPNIEFLGIMGYQPSNVLNLTSQFMHLTHLEIIHSPEVMKAVIQRCSVVQELTGCPRDLAEVAPHVQHQLRKVSVYGLNDNLILNNSPTTLQLFTANSDTIQELYLLEMCVGVDTSRLKRDSLRNVSKLTLDQPFGDPSNLLQACSNLKYFFFTSGYLKFNNDDFIMERVTTVCLDYLQDLDFFDGVDVGAILKKFPHVEVLTIKNTAIGIDFEDFSLSSLTFLGLKNVKMDELSKIIFNGKLPAQLRLDESMIEDCDFT